MVKENELNKDLSYNEVKKNGREERKTERNKEMKERDDEK